MARIWSCGFELGNGSSGVEYATSNFNGLDERIAPTPAIKHQIGGRGGNYSCRAANITGSGRNFGIHIFRKQNGILYYRVYLYLASYPNITTGFFDVLNDGNQTWCGFNITPTGIVKMRGRNSANQQVQIGADSSPLELNRWYCIELKLDTSGFPTIRANPAEGRINGVTFATGNADSSFMTTTRGQTRVVWGIDAASWGLEALADFYFDDIGVNNSDGLYENSWLGEGLIVHPQIGGPGDSTQLAVFGSSDPNWKVVSESPQNDGTQVFSGTLNQEDLYTFLPPGLLSTDEVKVVSVGFRAFYERFGAESLFRLLLLSESGGKRVESEDINVAHGSIVAANAWRTNQHPDVTVGSPLYFLTSYLDPDNKRWNHKTIASAQVGLRCSQARGLHFSVSTIWMMIEYKPSSVVHPNHKYYYYKIFDSDGYVQTWSEEVISEPKFRQVINGGPGELTIELARKFDDFGEDEDVKLNNRVELWVVDKDVPEGMLLYNGYISGYRPVIRETRESVVITVFSYISELSRMILRDASGNTTLTYNSTDPSLILRDVIDKYRAVGGRLNYNSTSIDLTNTTVSYTFNTNTVKECFDKVIELCPVGWYFRIDANGIVYLKPKSAEADHSFALGLDVENLETFRRIEDLVNRVVFTGGGGLYRKYENTGSQTTYGLYEKKVVDQRVTVAATASTISNRIIDSQKDPEIRSRFTIVDNNGPSGKGYDIESVQVGETLKVKNLKQGVKTFTYWDIGQWDVDVWDQTLANAAADIIQILSVEYTPDSIVIEASSRLPEVAKRIEDINRNLENSQTVNNPSAPS